MNEDIIAWLKVGAIDISYPVTQGKDNDYYLHNTFENQPNIAGCIFMDHGCKKIFRSEHDHLRTQYAKSFHVRKIKTIPRSGSV